MSFLIISAFELWALLNYERFLIMSAFNMSLSVKTFQTELWALLNYERFWIMSIDYKCQWAASFSMIPMTPCELWLANAAFESLTFCWLLDSGRIQRAAHGCWMWMMDMDASSSSNPSKSTVVVPSCPVQTNCQDYVRDFVSKLLHCHTLPWRPAG